MLQKVAESIPDTLKAVGEYFKDSKNVLLNTISQEPGTGTMGVLIKIFTKPLIDKYFNTHNKYILANYGLKTYLKASLLQAGKSLKNTIGELQSTYSIDGLLIGFEAALNSKLESYGSKEFILVFQPQYHPVVVEVAAILEIFLKNVNVHHLDIDKFRRDFNTNILESITTAFGEENYKNHLKEIRTFLLQENETELLLDNIQMSRIGFKEDESLTYETTFAEWKKVTELSGTDDGNRFYELSQIEEREAGLSEVQQLIQQYFETDPTNHLEKILFIVADFGKGKSVFLRHYAALLSKEYLHNGKGYFPVYFNLKSYNEYATDHQLGVIGNYLENRYGIKINAESSKNRRYIFLVDSLDECGDLDVTNIDKVIDSVKKIQNIDRVEVKLNKILVTTRPFDNGLRKHLDLHKPFCTKNQQGRPIPNYISLYGFKKDQFTHWLYQSIKKMPHLDDLPRNGVNGEIINAARSSRKIDLYNLFFQQQLISYNELRRPIFAYMIYQLLENAIDFSEVERIGIYLSFLNLLTKEAKYIHDINYNINLTEQFEARSILHSIAAIWLFNFNAYGKTEIKRADIYRSFKEELIDESDRKVITGFIESGQNELEFLSHSYFGDQDNTLHFQHQSFAEILMAEYYLKVLIKHVFEDELDVDAARVKLTIGMPTEQTIKFLTDLLALLRDSIEGENCIKKRKLLFPLLASLSLSKNNKSLSSKKLYYTWFNKICFEDNSSIIYDQYVEDWPINEVVLHNICRLCRLIIDSDMVLSIQAGIFKTVLFNNEVFVSKQQKPVQNIDKWIAFISANILFNNKQENKWFNSTIINQVRFLSNLAVNDGTPNWARYFFMGFNISHNNNVIFLDKAILDNYNFSYSKLHYVSFKRSSLIGAQFENCQLTLCDFSMSNITVCNFYNTEIDSYAGFTLSIVEQGVFFPYALTYEDWNDYDQSETYHETFGMFSSFGNEYIELDGQLIDYAQYFGNLLKSGYKRKGWSFEEIKRAIIVEDDKKEMFYTALKQTLES